MKKLQKINKLIEKSRPKFNRENIKLKIWVDQGIEKGIIGVMAFFGYKDEVFGKPFMVSIEDEIKFKEYTGKKNWSLLIDSIFNSCLECREKLNKSKNSKERKEFLKQQGLPENY